MPGNDEAEEGSRGPREQRLHTGRIKRSVLLVCYTPRTLLLLKHYARCAHGMTVLCIVLNIPRLITAHRR